MKLSPFLRGALELVECLLFLIGLIGLIAVSFALM
jgi:hypothetical protein